MKIISGASAIFCMFFTAYVFAGIDLDDAKVEELMQDNRYPNNLFIGLDVRQSGEVQLECHDNARWEYVLDISTIYLWRSKSAFTIKRGLGLGLGLVQE